MELVLQLLNGGAGSLASYLAAHVLLCLLPAFFIAGAMAALIPKASITHWLGRHAPVYVSYPAAALAGSLIAVCSCTIVPLFAGVYRKGAGIGPAITFLFFAPAGNIMALAYTGNILGADFAIARLILCLVFGIGIGLLMATLFWKDDQSHDARSDALFADRASVSRPALGVLLSLVALLIAGTLKLWPLSADLFSLSIPLSWAQTWQDRLFAWVPFDASKGEEGVSFQGSTLIALLLMIAATAKRGLDNITEGASGWTWLALGLAASTLLIASLRLTPGPGILTFTFTGRVLAVALTMLSTWHFARQLPAEDWQGWLWEAWRFVKQIFVVLVVGVFIVGMVRQVIQPEWIETLAGSNSVLANAVAVGFGVFMYFPTLVEVPVAKMFLDLGMHPGPLLAYLMADPELSLQSMLMVAAVIGRKKTAAYVGLVGSFSIVAGLLFGAWVDGTGWLTLGTGMAAWLLVVAGLYLLIRRQRTQTAS
ncbi:permease [Pseudomonas sp. L-22-4S-12]|uniref:permease n=1 Tax=Pseudomonas sp. L-22-4S-12 TaxID=2610893 RepID=UPI001325932B|nr:permease [Pseudomonas sp. L-22-4S-12]MWV18382.1 permease [Pseudomonas sp. L-22-4S-12]